MIWKYEAKRDFGDAFSWKTYIDLVVKEKVELLLKGQVESKSDEKGVRAGVVVKHSVYGEGLVTGMIAEFSGYPAKVTDLVYLISLPKEIPIDIDGKTLHHDRFGDGCIVGFIIVFQKEIMRLSYPTDFVRSSLVYNNIVCCIKLIVYNGGKG